MNLTIVSGALHSLPVVVDGNSLLSVQAFVNLACSGRELLYKVLSMHVHAALFAVRSCQPFEDPVGRNSCLSLTKQQRCDCLGHGKKIATQLR